MACTAFRAILCFADMGRLEMTFGALPEEWVAAASIHPGALATDAPDSPHHDLANLRG